MDQRDSHCPYKRASETTAKGTVLDEHTAGKEDPVELDFIQKLRSELKGVGYGGGGKSPPVKDPDFRLCFAKKVKGGKGQVAVPQETGFGRAAQVVFLGADDRWFLLRPFIAPFFWPTRRPRGRGVSESFCIRKLFQTSQLNPRGARLRSFTFSGGKYGWGGTSVKRQRRCPKINSNSKETNCGIKG